MTVPHDCDISHDPPPYRPIFDTNPTSDSPCLVLVRTRGSLTQVPDKPPSPHGVENLGKNWLPLEHGMLFQIMSWMEIPPSWVHDSVWDIIKDHPQRGRWSNPNLNMCGRTGWLMLQAEVATAWAAKWQRVQTQQNSQWKDTKFANHDPCHCRFIDLVYVL